MHVAFVQAKCLTPRERYPNYDIRIYPYVIYLMSFFALSSSTFECLTRIFMLLDDGQLVVSLTQEGLIRKVRAPNSDLKSKL